MSDLTLPRKFNNASQFLEGWYWALPSHELKSQKAKAVSFLGKELVLYRGADGAVRALDAYCPHMGAHLAEGKVEGNSIRCLFHGWKFGENGECQEIPCLERLIKVKTLTSYICHEQYGLVWLWTGTGEPAEFPEVPELAGTPVASLLGNRFKKNCHPNVVMINAIDVQHFNTVHPLVKKLAGGLQLEARARGQHAIEFQNISPIQDNGGLLNGILKPFYHGALTYRLCYWYGSTGTVTLGPDFLHFHIMFALKPTAEGLAEGQTILLTRKRPGIWGKIFNTILLRVTYLLGAYFAKGDTKIFRSIRFSLKTPIAADQAIIRFIRHAEKQSFARWGFAKRTEERMKKYESVP